MRTILTVLAMLIALGAAPAAAAERLAHKEETTAKPREISTISVGKRRIDLMATTRRARADTAMDRAHMDDCETMAKVMPGYPQPAFVSLGFRVKF
ncbi:MAG: hypothetical protein R3C58_13670 [Parvularculaceae bacterium]